MNWGFLMGLMATAMTAQPTAHELAAVDRWNHAMHPAESPMPELATDDGGLFVERQEWGTFRVNQSVTDEAMKIGDTVHERGLGSHAPSEVRVALPGPAARFEAKVGVDHNHFTSGGRGSVVFVVRARAEEVYRSDVMRGGERANEIEVELGGAAELTLIVEDGGDDVRSDAADWAEAKVTLNDGRTVWLDELPVLKGPVEVVQRRPFSFRLDGESSRGLLDQWERDGDAWTDPSSGLKVAWTVKTFDDHPAVEWMLEFENTGDEDSGLIEDIRALDLEITIPRGEHTHLRTNKGSACAIDDFLPMDQAIEWGKGAVELASVGGRSSNGTLPYWNLDWTTGGAIVAVGWSGQWNAKIGRPEQNLLRMSAGQETVRLRLRPGEKIRGPRMLVMLYQGEKERSYNLWRRLMLDHYCPRDEDGELIVPPVAHPTSRVLWAGLRGNEENQLEMLHAAADVGCEVFWLDAYWFPEGFPNGVGSWRHRTADFPNGLKPLSDAAHERGMEFCLWFEPERVFHTSDLGKEHPEFCLGAGEQRLYDLGNPEALAYMIELLNRKIDEYGVDIYREDFNFDPLAFWQEKDEPEREGMAEIRFTEGLYEMWDAIVKAHPGMPIDNCASGGRRIDLETVSRSYSLWRSDFQDVGILRRKNYPWVAAIAGQVQNVGLGMYVPFSAAAVYAFDPYSFRSSMSTGAPLYMDLRDPALDRELAKYAVAECQELREYWMGDLYPLTPITVDAADWCAFQLDRPERGDGIALYFRRHESPYLGLAANLKALDAEATYEYSIATDYGTAKARRATGDQLAAVPIIVEDRPGSALVRYRQIGFLDGRQ